MLLSPVLCLCVSFQAQNSAPLPAKIDKLSSPIRFEQMIFGSWFLDPSLELRMGCQSHIFEIYDRFLTYNTIPLFFQVGILLLNQI